MFNDAQTMKEEELRTNLLKSSKFKPQALNSSIENITKVKESLTKSPVVKQHKEDDHKLQKTDKPSSPLSELKHTSKDAQIKHDTCKSELKSSSLSEQNNTMSISTSVSQKPSNGIPVKCKTNNSSNICSKCRKKQVCNVRIQCKMDQYLASKLSSMKKEMRLSLRMPRLPLPTHELSHLKYGKYIRYEEHPNGGAKILRLYWDEILHLKSRERHELASEFLKETFV